MATMSGFLIGDDLGVKAGPNGYEEPQQAWKTISSSAEVKDMISGGLSISRDVVRQASTMLAHRLGESEAPLRRVA